MKKIIKYKAVCRAVPGYAWGSLYNVIQKLWEGEIVSKDDY